MSGAFFICAPDDTKKAGLGEYVRECPQMDANIINHFICVYSRSFADGRLRDSVTNHNLQ